MQDCFLLNWALPRTWGRPWPRSRRASTTWTGSSSRRPSRWGWGSRTRKLSTGCFYCVTVTVTIIKRICIPNNPFQGTIFPPCLIPNKTADHIKNLSTGWPSSLFLRFCWYQIKGCVFVHGPYIKTQPLFWCHPNLENNLLGHPVPCTEIG